MIEIDLKKLYNKLYFSPTEQDVERVIEANPGIFKQDNWYPFGNNSSNFGVIENQQSNPIAALIEKVTNSIDATLTKRCHEENIDPKSIGAPKSMDDAV